MKSRISRNSRWLTVLASIVATVLSMDYDSESGATERTAPRRPNLVFVFADQMRGTAMGFLGEEPVVTPHLDRFAQQSIVFTQAASNYPVCSPCRAMLLTGQYPHHNHVISNCLSRTAPYGVELQADAKCWSDVLKDCGYSLGYIGKWHLEAPHKPYIDCANMLRWNSASSRIRPMPSGSQC